MAGGQLNAGVVEPVLVTQMAAAGLEKNAIRTSCLGFGEGYNEDLLDAMAKATGGALHNANQPDQLPEVFRKELDGLQSVIVQNLRVRARSCGFVERIAVLGDYVELALPGWGLEVSVGDLVSGERRVLVLALDVLPIPFGADGQAVANLHGEDLVGVGAALRRHYGGWTRLADGDAPGAGVARAVARGRSGERRSVAVGDVAIGGGRG